MKTTHHQLWAAALLAGILAATTIRPALAQAYSITNIGVQPVNAQSGNASVAYGAGGFLGVTVGRMDDASNQHAFYAINGTMHELGLASGFDNAISTAIKGIDPVGYMMQRTDSRSVIWPNGGAPFVLPLPANAKTSGAMAVNVHGVIGGWYTDQSNRFQGYVYNYNLKQYLWSSPGQFGSGSAGVSAINNHGSFAGDATMPNGEYHAFLVSGGNRFDIHDKSVFPGQVSATHGMNEAETVVGRADITDQLEHAFASRIIVSRRTKTRVMQDLGTLPGTNNSVANAINNHNMIVGYCNQFANNKYGDHRAFVFMKNKMYDLNKLIPADSGWVLQEAYAVNDYNEIAGVGLYNGTIRAFLLTPK